MLTGSRNAIDTRRFWFKAFGLMIALGAAEPVHAAQALLVCTIVQTPTQDNTNTKVKILNNCCTNLATGAKIAVTAGQNGVAPGSLTLTLEKPLMKHQTAEFVFYVSVPRATWCSASSR
jgi:hypothetical protein